MGKPVSYSNLIKAIRLTINQVHDKPLHWVRPCTVEQAAALVALLERGLGTTNRDLRMAVLDEILGYSVVSTRDLMKWEAHTLIEYLKGEDWKVSQDGRIILEGARSAVQARAENLSH